MSKFASSRFWRVRGNCCLFLEVLEIVDNTPEVTTIRVAWHRRSNGGYRQVGEQHLKINSEDLGDYYSYVQPGEKISV